MSRLFSIREDRVKDLRGDFVSQEKKKWSSESDLHRLPPLSRSPAFATSPRLSRKDNHRLHTPRPPTPSPNMHRRGDLNSNCIFGKQRLAPLSPSNSTQRLSLNLDLNTLKEEIVAIDGRSTNNSPDREKFSNLLDSPRMPCVRSLPSSPVMRRAITRTRSVPQRRLNSDSKEDRIAEWVRDVQKYEDNIFVVPPDDEILLTSDSNEYELGSSPSLPAIKENVTHHSS